jgi:Xaa-Pro aminopeptidase
MESNDEFSVRRDAFAASLAERKLDAFLVSFGPNLRYLSGFTGSNALLLVMPGRSILFTDPRYQIQAAQEVSCSVTVAKGPLEAAFVAAITRHRVRRTGYEPALMSCEAFRSLESSLPSRASLVAAGGSVERLRMIKSPSEIERIRRSVLTNSRAFEQTVPRVRAGITERDFAAEIEYRMRRLGAEKPSFETIVAAGPRSALPHAQPTTAPLQTGQLVVVDMGTFEDGYASDMTRTLYLGSPTPKVKRMYRAVLEAQLAAIDTVHAGARTARVDAAAREVLKGYRLDHAFIHSTGHGLGLEIHEPPRLGRSDKGRLESGMAITIEPGVYFEGFGGIRIEDTVIVTKKGCEILTPTSKDLWVI